MNERIKELFKRAGGKTSIHNLMSNPMQQREYNELWDENITKFAELIVKECANFTDHAEELYKHFGVEDSKPVLGPGVNYRPTYPDQE